VVLYGDGCLNGNHPAKDTVIPGLTHRHPGLDPGSIIFAETGRLKWIPGQAWNDGCGMEIYKATTD
jgi:hypothetical protein